ncbi:MAG: ATP-binding cassette domain-containing protein [Clostridiales bacterium]|jgi:zinc transport system ATP-binding protein|nr:ATP-binding cassette domain-containing protein [Clostridiales bacterium]
MENRRGGKEKTVIISCKNVTFAYDGFVVASRLNFDVARGDYLCVVGENGAGKSTLIKGLLGLKLPQSGSITFGSGLTLRHIGYLPQQTAAQKDFPASAYEVVLSGRLEMKAGRLFYSREDKNAAVENMRRLGIADLRGKCYRDLSGGQQQRVLLARALCATSEVIILDEPAAGLDPLAASEMYALIARLNNEGITIIMVSHDIAASTRYAKHVLHLANKQLFWGDTAAYKLSNVGFM